MTEPINVYLTDVDLSAIANVLRGVRECLRLLRDPDVTSRVPLADAEAILTRYREGERPCFIGNARDADHAREVAHATVAAAHERIGIGVGLSDAEVQQIAAEHQAADEPEPPELPPDLAGPMAPLTPPTLIPADEADDDEPPSLAACKAAIALMAMHEGNGTRALIWGRVLAETTGDRDWTGACRLILASLPLKDPSA